MALTEGPVPSVAPVRLPGLQTQAQGLLAQRGHAWLLHGPSGLGQFELALWLARSWLCEQSTPESPLACGRCASCHAIDVHAHADLAVLMPETEMLERGWPLAERAQSEIDEKKRKPSREIRVDALRDAIAFAQRTSARGRGLVVLVYPADRMNGIAANALLKTLEEPPGNTRFLLATEAAHALLPTIRSRCMSHAMAWPAAHESLAWLQAQGLPEEDAQMLWQASGGRLQEALALHAAGVSAAVWRRFPAAMRQGEASHVHTWPAQRLIESLHKLCHDHMAQALGGSVRFFRAEDLAPPRPTGRGAHFAASKEPSERSVERLAQWGKSLQDAARHADHPWNAGLMTEHLVAQAARALNFTAS
jgi:DNA polymerase-3 subunit delta'